MRRPVAVTIVAGSLCIAAAIAAVVGIALLFPGTFLERMWQYNLPARDAFHRLGRALGIAFLLLSVVAGFAGRGLLRGRRAAWWAAIAIFAINGLGDSFDLIRNRDIARDGSSILIGGIFLVLLLNRRVRRYLTEKSAPSDVTPDQEAL